MRLLALRMSYEERVRADDDVGPEAAFYHVFGLREVI